MKALQDFLRPEFLNRVDEIVCFNQLTEENFRGIAAIMLEELAGALRIWRFLLAVLASTAGLFGVVAGAAMLVCHLAGIESFGVSYLTPFAANAGEQVEGHAVLRRPLKRTKLRPAALRTRNRRNQR